MNSRTDSIQTSSSISSTICVNIHDLPFDLKRMLRVQWKEFVNCIEDAQLHIVEPDCPKPTIDNFARTHTHTWVAA